MKARSSLLVGAGEQLVAVPNARALAAPAAVQPQRSRWTGTRVVLSYGLGVDSTALLLRWLEEPASRDFSLGQLLVVTSMTGDEWPRTGRLVEEHVLPRLREHGVRCAQVARRGASQKDGIVVLDDSDAPWRLYLDGAYKLSQELAAAGTRAAGERQAPVLDEIQGLGD